MHEVEYKMKVRDPEGGPLIISFTSDLLTIGDFVQLIDDTFIFKPKIPQHIT